MPFKSLAQERFAYANPGTFGGKHALEEWMASTPKNLPKKLHPEKKVKVGAKGK